MYTHLSRPRTSLRLDARRIINVYYYYYYYYHQHICIKTRHLYNVIYYYYNYYNTHILPFLLLSVVTFKIQTSAAYSHQTLLSMRWARGRIHYIIMLYKYNNIIMFLVNVKIGRQHLYNIVYSLPDDMSSLFNIV